MAENQIRIRKRNYFKEGQKYNARNWEKMDFKSHPLSLVYTTEIVDTSKTNRGQKQKKSKRSQPEIEQKQEAVYDPLSQDIDPLRADIDPLQAQPSQSSVSTVVTASHAQTHKSANKDKTNASNNDSKDDNALSERELKLKKERLGLPPSFETWREKRGSILLKYTSNKRIGVTANFLDEKEEDGKQQGSENEELKKKIEQLEMDKKEDKLFLSQTEYIRRMEHNVKRLRKAWQDGKRVLSLKIAIQSAKLLCENSVNTCPQFFPSMFALVADILDSFGDLVFSRLKMKASSGKDKKVRDNFTSVDVNLEAQETCQNWFYKIACIRELSPRLFIELALFGCWRFIREPSELYNILRRLSMMIRGIGDPLVAAYARAYLVHVGFGVLREKMRPVMLETFDDFLFAFNQIEKSNFQFIYCVSKKEKISKSDYIDLFAPCLDWVVQCISFKASEEEFFALIQRYKSGWNNSIILLHILRQFDNKYISKHAKGVSRLIRESFVTTIARSLLYKELGHAMVEIAPPTKIRLTLLNDIWKVVSKIDDAQEYVNVASVYIEYLLQHFGKKEIDILLGDVIKHLSANLAFEKLQSQVFLIVSHILRYFSDLTDLFEIMNFLTLIDMLSSTHKLLACKMILMTFFNSADMISSPVMINSLMDVSRMLHDSVDYLTYADEKRVVTELICHLIDYIDYGHDLEKQLNEYVDYRSTFSNLDGVIYLLCYKVGNLAMKAHTFMRGKHSKQTGAFVKACLAYCHVTIPSLQDLWPRMYLFSNLAQIALTNSMIISAEALFVAAIKLIPKLPITFAAASTNQIESTAKLLCDFIANFSGTLLLMPGHPTHGPFYLLKELMTAMEQWPPWAKDKITVEKCEAHIHLFQIACTSSQSKFPYTIKGVSSNDDLYAQNTKYLNECEKIVNRLGRQIHSQLLELKGSQRSLDKQASGYLGLQFINCMLVHVISDAKACKIVKIVHSNIINAPNLNKKFYKNTMMFIKQRNPVLYQELRKQEE